MPEKTKVNIIVATRVKFLFFGHLFSVCLGLLLKVNFLSTFMCSFYMQNSFFALYYAIVYYLLRNLIKSILLVQNSVL